VGHHSDDTDVYSLRFRRDKQNSSRAQIKLKGYWFIAIKRAERAVPSPEE
jgi:hypothetical protein